uniref:Uncharacterized protein n=1 Tax=Arundo donax TaxID=35708 RepID=A0A0A9A523_ARUDO
MAIGTRPHGKLQVTALNREILRLF